MAEHMLNDDETTTGLLERWRQTEPVRLWLYGIAVPLLLALVGYGLLTDHHSALWLAVLQAALLGGGTEVARGFAVSPATTALAAEDSARLVEDGHTPEAAARIVRIRYRIPT